MRRTPIFALAAAALVAQAAHATLPRPAPGAQRVLLKVDPKTYAGLKQGGVYKTGTPLPMAVSFDLPQDSSCVVRVAFTPVAGTVEVPSLSPLTTQGNSVTTPKEAIQLLGDASLGAASRLYQMSCGEFQIGSRVQIPFTFKSNARAGTGTATNVSVEVFGGKNLARARGYATLVMAVNDAGVLKISSTEAINAAQRERILKDPAVQLREIVATDTLPLDESTVPKTTSWDMSKFAKDPSTEEGQQ